MNKELGLPDNLAAEIGKLNDAFDVLYDELYPDDDGDYNLLMNDYYKSHASPELKKRLNRHKGWNV